MNNFFENTLVGIFMVTFVKYFANSNALKNPEVK